MHNVTFNPAQIHILNMASRIKTEAGLQRFKEQMATFYAKLIDEELDELWASGQWNEQKLADLRGAHHRTPYK